MNSCQSLSRASDLLSLNASNVTSCLFGLGLTDCFSDYILHPDTDAPQSLLGSIKVSEKQNAIMANMSVKAF